MKNNKEKALEFIKDHHINIDNDRLILMALTHPSYAQERNSVANNQRLEFLGDAVLNLVVAEYLYKHFCDKAEGELTKIRAKVVCEKALVGFASRINLGNYILLGKGEEMSGGRRRKSILADTTEAIIGAIYLQNGYESARDFVLLHMQTVIEETAQGDYQDYKSRLQEIVQGISKENITYSILEESGPAHAKNFVAGVFHKGNLLATGEGRSKKEAEQHSAEKVIKSDHLLEAIIRDKDL
ncbi:MAG: ribonuclease III [Syntrophomonadaceae bacterium]|jgi:ribonuclease-3